LLLQGAAHVVALDAGCDQLHKSLREDARVTNVEKYNARELSAGDVGHFELVVMDVSFISQTYILPHIGEVLLPGGEAVTLIKPQFEAGRAALNKNGLVKDPRDRVFAIRRVLESARAAGLVPKGLILSPIRGGDGNEEYLVHFATEGEDLVSNDLIEKTVTKGR
jgi:23S rRNA (cytidine1920-2'-O)/16S rRNA (cytidine1409-2'-O)-methyltransferase